MKKRWFARIRANDNEKGFIIKIGIDKVDDLFLVISDRYNEQESFANTQRQAEKDIYSMWGTWKTFKWL
jgi:hypothetical protein